eukprot:GFYU01000879.1.p1 GENE.GFYU01000879.1~~GFYU01000879.1.p1  ORF type:complete len:250 (+),score=32.57 GFYU01000879.1:114-863(+)
MPNDINDPRRRVEEEDEDSEEDSEDVTGSEDEDVTWVSWYCSLKGNEFLCEVEEDFIQDDFNLTGLSSQVVHYDYALDLMLDMDSPMDDLAEDHQEMVESAAEALYGLIHARYILTTRGLNAMLEKYKNADFGRCPRVYCEGQPVLPIGLVDIPRQSSVKVYCPKCEDIYHPKSSRQANLDGAYFGTTFPHLLLLSHSELLPLKNPTSFTPRIYGFRVSADSAIHTSKRRFKESKEDKHRDRDRQDDQI